MISFVEANESGKRSASRLLDAQGVNAMSSTYRRSKTQELSGKWPDLKMSEQKKQTCIYCCCAGHGKHAPPNVWAKECPTYSHRCKLCNRDHHTEAVCRSKENPKPLAETTNASTQEAAAFSQFSDLCTLTSTDHNNGGILALDHHLYNNLSNAWRKSPSRAQPYIRLNVSANKQDYKDMGLRATPYHLTSVPISHGRHWLSELSCWYTGSQSLGSETRRLDTCHYDNACWKREAHQHPWGCHPSFLWYG